MADQEFILAPPTVTVKFGLEQVKNTMNSISLLSQVVDRSGFGTWVEETQAALSEEQRTKNFMVMKVFYKATYSDAYHEATTFEEYLERIANLDPLEVRDDVVNGLVEKCCEEEPDLDLDADTIIHDKATFLEAVDKAYRHHYEEHGKVFNIDAYAMAHPLFSDPDAMLATIVEQLRYMWDEHLKDNWATNLPMLKESIHAFKQMDFNNYTTIQAVRTVTGRDLAGYWDKLDTAKKITFIPSAHIGPYVTFFDEDEHMKEGPYLIFGARVPEGVVKSPALSRSELLVRLNALADDTRLQILELLAETPELCAQDIINELDLSQSSASRHLRQLTATGYLIERRREVAKCYTVNRERFSDTLSALKHFMRNR